MRAEPIILKWTEKGKEHIKEINRKEFFDLMRSIKNAFSDDNEISSIFVEIIPNLDLIIINKDRNEDVEIPYVYYKQKSEPQKEIRIRRNYHKIIWSILDYFCSE